MLSDLLSDVSLGFTSRREINYVSEVQLCDRVLGLSEFQLTQIPGIQNYPEITDGFIENEGKQCCLIA